MKFAGELLLFLSFMAALAAPGLPWAALLFRGRGTMERAILGVSLSLAAFIFLAFAGSYQTTRLALPLWALWAAAGFWRWRRLPGRPPLWEKPDGLALALGTVLLLTAAGRFAITYFHILPMGWDPTFHLILAQKIALEGKRIIDWRPFEDFALNYPIGSHLLIAEIHRATLLPLHTVFKWLVPWFGVLSTAQVYLLTATLFGRRQAALWAALAFSGWAMLGSIGYYSWGGLPNLMALGLFVCALVLLLPSLAPVVGSIWIPAFFLAAASFVHHHVMITFLFLLAGLLPLAPRRIGATLLAWLAGGAFYLIPYATRVVDLQQTAVISYLEPMYTLPRAFREIGPAYCLALLLGLWPLRREIRGEAVRWWWYSLCLLLVIFVVSDQLIRLICDLWLGIEFAPFTPSRFLTDLVLLAAPLAGLGLEACLQRWRIGLVPALLLLLTIGISALPEWRAQYRHRDNRAVWETLQWIRGHTPPQAVIFNTVPWASYGSWRRSYRTPVPSSEPLPPLTPRQQWMRALSRGEAPPQARGLLLIAIRPTREVQGKFPILWSHPQGFSVIRLPNPSDTRPGFFNIF